jgi:hypothetical protein
MGEPSRYSGPSPACARRDIKDANCTQHHRLRLPRP